MDNTIVEYIEKELERKLTKNIIESNTVSDTEEIRIWLYNDNLNQTVSSASY